MDHPRRPVLRLVFAGTPVFAQTALAALHAAGQDVALVLTQPDRPAGRGLQLQASPVKQWALAHGVPVAQPRSLRTDGRYPQDADLAAQALKQAQADCMVVAAYGLILPLWVLQLMADRSHGALGLGCLNIHASLLPRWRGAAPIHRAIQAGDAQTGVTIMQMDAGLDTGDMLLAEALSIAHSGATADTTATLHDRLAEQGARLIVRALALAEQGALQAQPQPLEGVSYAAKIDKSEAAIDWRLDAQHIASTVRALNPSPGAQTLWRGELLKLWHAHAEQPSGPAEAASHNTAPGTVLSLDSQAVRVACGRGVVRLTELQRAGAKRLALADWLRGNTLQAGDALGGPATEP